VLCGAFESIKTERLGSFIDLGIHKLQFIVINLPLLINVRSLQEVIN
jgi:hypothetical protein